MWPPANQRRLSLGSLSLVFLACWPVAGPGPSLVLVVYLLNLLPVQRPKVGRPARVPILPLSRSCWPRFVDRSGRQRRQPCPAGMLTGAALGCCGVSPCRHRFTRVRPLATSPKRFLRLPEKCPARGHSCLSKYKTKRPIPPAGFPDFGKWASCRPASRARGTRLVLRYLRSPAEQLHSSQFHALDRLDRSGDRCGLIPW